MSRINYDREHLAAVLERIGRTDSSDMPEDQVIQAAREYFDRVKNDVGPFARLSRVRLEAFGATPGAVRGVLLDHAQRVVAIVGETSVSYGEEVLERDLNFTAASDYAWRGRLLLHCDVSGGTEE